jgi:hypothetical protein
MTLHVFKKNTAKKEVGCFGAAFLVLLAKDLACFGRRIREVSARRAIESTLSF